MVVMLIMRALKRLKAGGYKQSLAQLNEGSDCKFVALANCELAVFRTRGILLQRPAIVSGIKDWVSHQFQTNKRIFAALENPENKNEFIFLLFKPQDLDYILTTDDGNDLLEGGNLDSGFSTNRGLSVLTSNNTVVKKGSHEGLYFSKSSDAGERVYVFQPHSKTFSHRTASFEIKFVVDDEAQSKANVEEAEQWIESKILTLEHNTAQMNTRESLKVEPSE